jgi:hypothetical protein
MREVRSPDDNGLWYLVQYDEAGATGWVSASYVLITQ